MNTPAEKTPKNEHRSIAYRASQKHTGLKPGLLLSDNRPEAVVQRKLQEKANNSAMSQKVSQVKSRIGNTINPKDHPIQRMQGDSPIQLNGETALEIALQNPAFKAVMSDQPAALASLRMVNKRMRGLVDGNFINPRTWAVLHSMRETSFNKLLAAMKVPNARPNFEKSGSKYNPSDYDGKHTWEGNVRWLSDISNKFNRVVLTALPITVSKLLRQPSNIRGGPKHQFSALAREMAYLFSKGIGPIPGSSMTVGDLEVQKFTALTQQLQLAIQNHLPVLRIVLAGDATKINHLVVLATFRALGVICSNEHLEEERSALEKYQSETAGDLSKIVLEYIAGKDTTYKNLKADPAQWSEDTLKKMVGKVSPNWPSKAEVKQWRVKLVLVYKQRGNSWG